MRRLIQLGAVLTLVLSGVMLVGSFTAADATATQRSKPGVLQAGWFWETAYQQANPPVAAGPLPATEPSGVPDGDFAVAHTSNDASSSKMTALAFDIGTPAPGSFINTFTFSVTVDSSSQATNIGTGAQPIVACLPTQLWSPAVGGDYTGEPAVDCSTKVKPKVKGSTYTFEIPAIAQDWVDDQNVGVALVNDPDNTSTPFQVVFTGPKTVKATMSYTPGTPVPAATTPPGGSLGGSSSVGGTTSSGGSVPPPAMGNAPPAPNVTTSDVGQAPQVAPTSNPQLKPVAKVSAASSLPSRGFWMGAAAFAFLILLMSLVLGDQPQPAGAAGSRLDRVLRGASADTSALASRS